MIKNSLVYVLVILIVTYVVGDEYKSSLTFVIDDTGSMGDDIDAVKNGANAIFDTVLNSNASQIDNFILVTFNDFGYDDPGVKLQAKTKNRHEFKAALSSIVVDGGGDCPEYSMAGIKLALEESLPVSYLYIFTDASAKDYDKFEEVKSIAQKKQSQVTFVLTGYCSYDDSPDYQVYYDIANATFGEVFNLEKQEVGLILEYVKNNIKGRMTTLGRMTLPPGSHSFNITVDSKTKDTTVSLASSKRDSPTISVTASDGSKAAKKIILETERNKIYSVNVTKPGNHTVEVVSKSKTKVVVTARSTVNFIHGFSIFMPSSIKDTSTRPVPDVKSHLAIKLTEGDIKLKTTKILDMHDNLMLEMPLIIKDKKNKFYMTQPFDTPKTMFQIAITGYDPESKSVISRMAATPVEPQKIVPGETVKNVAPAVVIEGENKINVEHDKPLQLICNVNAYPKPSIVWKKKDEETILSEQVTIKDLPYDYVSILTIENISNNATYRCEATNPSGSDAKDVTVETNRKRFFNVTKTPKRIAMEFQKEGKIYCIVDAYPPANIAWFKNGRQILPGGYIDLSHNKSILTIKYVTTSDKGKYVCEAWNEDKRQIFKKHVTVVGVERPIIDKNITEVSVKIGSSTEIECKILSGKPKPSISWFYKTGVDSTELISLDEWEDQERIKIDNAGKNDSGIYQCQADNEVNTDSHEIDLIVEYQPTIAEDVERIKEKVGSEILISCNVDGGPTPYVTWLKDDIEITKSDKIRIFGNQTLKLVGKSSDSGYYTCKATNKLGSVAKTVKVDISDPVTITLPKKTSMCVVVGSELMLPCEAKGDPKPEIKWVYQSFSAPHRKNIVSKRENALHLEHIQVKEEGYYTCIASNIDGAVNITYSVQVIAPPIIENTYKDKHFVAVEGDRVLRITCKASGNPKPTITWIKDGWNLALGSTFDVDGDTLFIKNVPMSASGVYKCEAENSKGVAQEIYEVSVEKYPPSRRVTSSVIIEKGKPSEIKCDVPHNKIDQLRWYKNGELIRHGNLVLTNPSVEDSGHYTCRVGNFIKSVSGNVRVTVGYKPQFSTTEDEDVELAEGPPVSLNCETRALPKPVVAWYHDGEKLNSTEDQYYFPTGIHSPGQYKCEVTNVFGTTSRTFNVVPRDCFVNTEKLTNLQPLMVTSYLAWPTIETYKNFMIIPKGEQLVLFCPNRFKMFPKKYKRAFCDGGMNILVEGNKYDYSDIQCTEEVTHEILKTGRKCMPGNTEMVKIVYKVLDYENIEVYDICLDKTKNIPLYAKHTLQRSSANNDYNTTWSDSDQFPMNFEEAYDCKNQINTISARLGKWFHYRDECCFSKQQLVNPRDVFPGVAQRSTYSYLNVVPHWGSCNNGNWEEIEQRVRKFAKSLGEVLVWTGTAKELSLSTASYSTTSTFFGDRRGNHQAVPIFFWKVVQDQITRKSLAIVQVSIPDLSLTEVSKYVLCKDICAYTDWINSSNWQNVTKGYTYCCNLDEFEAAFGFRDVFEPYPEALLSTDAFVLPESSLAIIA